MVNYASSTAPLRAPNGSEVVGQLCTLAVGFAVLQVFTVDYVEAEGPKGEGPAGLRVGWEEPATAGGPTVGMSVLDTLALCFKLFRRPTDRDITVDHVQWWAGRHEVEVIDLERCGIPPSYVLRRFPPSIVPRGQSAHHHYFQISAIDVDHVRHWGVARVWNQIEIIDGMDVTVQVVWLRSEQLDWRARPPRRTAELPHGRAQGWYTDPTRAHELRWYSAGTPTDLVKDGAIESRDTPPSPAGP